MKKFIYTTLLIAPVFFSSCVREFEPQQSYVTEDQAQSSQSAFNDFVSALTTPLSGQATYGNDPNGRATDFGLTSFFIMRDVMGQDIFPAYDNWWSPWYCCIGQSPTTAYSQYPLTEYYKWIKSCNSVISIAGEDVPEEWYSGVGQAYAMRAFFYLDIAQMYAPETYVKNPQGLSCVYISEKTTFEEAMHNPRKTNQEIFSLILSDLDQAENYLADYKRADVYTPDITVAYGLKARAYLLMGDWANAEKYAKLAQQGYSMMTAAQYTDRNTGFNTPNNAWMFATRFQAQDPCILENDADTSWGSHMSIEINPEVSGCGYASNYGQPLVIDRHLYETMPFTDIRKACFVDFSIDDYTSEEEIIMALEAYSNYPSWVYSTGYDGYYGQVGGLSLKFRVAGGTDGHNNQYIGFLQSIPLMRVEEMMLIEAEAAGMQDEGRGIQLLTSFAQKRDPNFVYGTHNEAYGNTSTSAFQNECWWQRRVEFWGEGLATFDIKRLQKGIIRSYAGTNQLEDYRWNLDETPAWMTYVYCQTESNYNYELVNNPTPVPPIGDSEPYVW